MDPVNNSFDIFEKIEESDRKKWHHMVADNTPKYGN